MDGSKADNGKQSWTLRDCFCRLARRRCGCGPLTHRALLSCQVAGNWDLRWKFWINVLISSLFLVVLYQLDPFGLSTLSKHHSQRLFQRWTATLYPAHKTAGEINVVLFSDNDLKKMQHSWPPPYAVHSNVLDRILECGPKAVLVDIAFIDPIRVDLTLEDLQETIQDYREKKVPIFFAAGHTNEQLPQGMHPELVDAGAIPIGVPGPGNNRQSFAYPLEMEKYENYPSAGKRLSAAAALYGSRQLDLESVQNNKLLRDELMESGIIDDRVVQNMQVVWRLYPEGENNGPFRCEQFTRSPLKNIWDGLSWNIFGPGDSLASESREHPSTLQSCPPQESITVERLLFDQDPTAVMQLCRSLKQSFVIYGAYIAFNEDLVDPPTHSPIPGAYFHAMALDNLLAFGNEFRRVLKPNVNTFWFDTPTAIELITLLLLVTLAQYSEFVWQGLAPSKPDQNSGISWLIVVTYLLLFSLRNIFFIIVLLMGGAFISTYVFLSPSIDFLGLLGLLGITCLPIIGRLIAHLRNALCLD